MMREEKIYVAGHAGMVGSALVRRLKAAGCTQLVTRTHSELDLTDARAVRDFFEREHPLHVYLAAAKVGGIHANNTYPAEFIYQNIAIQTNVIDAAWRCGVKRLLFLGSSCIYPRECPQPIKEEYWLTGPLEPTNRAYAIAKISGIEMCWAYNRQYRTDYASVMPTNLYGPGDNYDLQNSHVLPALIRKMHEAKVNGDAEVPIWGSGQARREFLYSDDMADACILLMNLPDDQYRTLAHPDTSKTSAPPMVNVGCGPDLTIRELALTAAKVVGFGGKLAFDTSKPDGAPRKILDVSRMQVYGWRPKVGLEQGIALAYCDYLDNQSK